jgi:hypothetical protein
VPCSYVPDGATKFEYFLVLQGNFGLDTSFCNWNFRSPAWDNNVMGLHGSYCKLVT